MLNVLHREHVFFGPNLSRITDGRYNQTQADLVDQLFNSAEKRLARTLLLPARFGKKGKSENVVPKISQETLAAMIGTTRARINFFMNRFRQLGLMTVTVGWKCTVRCSTSCCKRKVSLPKESGGRLCTFEQFRDS